MALEVDRARRVERVAGEDEHRRGLTRALEVDRFGGPLAERGRGAIEGGEHEVAGVEDPGGAALEALGAAPQAIAGGEDADLGAPQAGLERVGVAEALGEVLFKGFGAAGDTGDAGGELGGAAGEQLDLGADRFDFLDQALGAAFEFPVCLEDLLGGVGELPGAVAELSEG